MSYREDERRENEVWGFMGIEQTKRYQQEGGSNHKLKKNWIRLVSDQKNTEEHLGENNKICLYDLQ
jgi:hypothetical protein